MPAGGAGSVGTGTARTFRRIVPGGDSMVTRSSSFPLPSMSAAATTVTRLRRGRTCRRSRRRAVDRVGGRRLRGGRCPGRGRRRWIGARRWRSGVGRWGSRRSPRALPTARVRARRSAPVRAPSRPRGCLDGSAAGACDGSALASADGWPSCCDPGADGSRAMTWRRNHHELASSSAVCSRTTPLKRARPR